MNRYHLAILALIAVIVVLLLASVAHSAPTEAQPPPLNQSAPSGLLVLLEDI